MFLTIFENVFFYRFSESSLIVDGKAVVAILKSTSLKEQFSFVSSRCRTVVACRLAPVQKSQLVRMIKEASNDNVTAAIGDGGNDISMIQGKLPDVCVSVCVCIG